MSFSYKKSGVDYNLLDPVKKMAQVAGLATKNNLNGSGFKEISESRGETAYIIEASDCYFAIVEEGLGTKNLIADEMRKITGKTYYDAIANDTVISIVMDLTSVGARPLIIMSYWAVGNSEWLSDKKRTRDFIDGWKKACDSEKISWGGGETPTLNGIVSQNTIDLAGAAFGIIKPKERIVMGERIQAEDVIILFESSGIHVNGLTLARKIADKSKLGFATKLKDGRLYGEVLLTPTVSYSRVIHDMQEKGIDIHYMVNITGHGWRKLMRARKPFSYIIDKNPPTSELFSFIQKYSGLSIREMYATFNMGAGFAVYIPHDEANKVLEIAKKNKIKAWVGGKIEKGLKQVVIKPLNITYREDELRIR